MGTKSTLFSITVITKLYTPNAGNQAISTELVNLLSRTFPNARINAGWRNSGLEQYTYKKLRDDSSDPIDTLDKWSEHILESYNSSKTHLLETVYDSETTHPYEISHKQYDPAGLIELAPIRVYSLPRRFINKVYKIYKSVLDRSKGYSKQGEKWIEVLKNSNLVIYSPAGEIRDTRADYLVKDFLNLRIAQKSGAKVVSLNQSIEFNDPYLVYLIGRLYSSFAAISVRDYESIELLKSANVPANIIKFSPDTSLLAQKASLGQQKTKEILECEHIEPDTVGICVRSEKRINYDDWGKTIQHLRTLGKKVLFVSNQMFDDVEAARKLLDLYDIDFLTRQYDYEEYIALLSLLDFVISERYHTCIFSAIAGKPFIALRWSNRKMLGLCPLFNYPIQTVDDTHVGWHESVIEDINNIYKDYDGIVKLLHESVEQRKNNVIENILSVVPSPCAFG
jgi:polysaccharide pyruvyl transferase WcaK-like protein